MLMAKKQVENAGTPSLAASLLLALALLSSVAHALHFYIRGTEQKCFTEDLAKDTVVHGDYRLEMVTGEKDPSAVAQGLRILVEELPSRHRVLNQKSDTQGKFAFTAAQSGEHAICLSTNGSSWFHTSTVRVFLDLHIGDAEVYEDDHKNTVNDFQSRLRELTNRAVDIRREQVYQRGNEAKFRDMSESVNSRVVYWTIVQLFVIACTGVWQMRHLKNFFTAKKLV